MMQHTSSYNVAWAASCFHVDMAAYCPFTITSLGESPDLICTQIWDQELIFSVVQWIEDDLMGMG